MTSSFSISILRDNALLMSQVDEFDFNTYIIICAVEDTNLQSELRFRLILSKSTWRVLA